jgi:hypothetical protein
MIRLGDVSRLQTPSWTKVDQTTSYSVGSQLGGRHLLRAQEVDFTFCARGMGR